MANTAEPTVWKTDDKKFREALAGEGSATTEVSTDPRVFERITLGLYREPSAAIRELISNAYDADAQNVTVKMNPPYFDRITVEDDGIGMSSTTIDHIVHHVGGSLKRSVSGEAAGVTRSVGTSPMGRKLIGQMGIGLFSVARLTRKFTIETKQRGAQHRIRLEMDLTGLDPAVVQAENSERYVAGYAKVSRERVHPAEVKQHYTRIMLYDILPEAQRILRSVDRWDNLKANVHARKGEMKYHIGRLDPVTDSNPPWTVRDKTPLSRFKAMVDALAVPAEVLGSSPSLDQTLDYYLAMIWRISLSAPLNYIEKNPFALTNEDGIEFYTLDRDDGTPESLPIPDGVSIGNYLDVHADSNSTPFKVIIDNVELRRPIIFRPFTPDARKLLPRPKMLIGSFASKADGADLAGTAYLYWSYEVAPKENNGILVRINGASGTLFDRTFLGFRTSENLRLRQVSSEAFIIRGLDGALNIDRESFVDSDPNVRALQRWTHRSMTRLFTRIKMDQRSLGAERKERTEAEEARETEAAAEKIWTRRRGTARAKPPRVVVSSRSAAPADVADEAIFIGGITSPKRGGVEKEQVFSARLRAAVLVLDGWGLLDTLSDEERTALVEDLAKVIDRRT